MPKRAVVAWCLYDWANSAFPTVIQTFVFSAYFATAVAVSSEAGQEQWGHANSLAGFAIAILSPVFGAIADQGGPRKPWLLATSLLCVLATAALWFVRPAPGDAVFALAAMGLATVGFEVGLTFYNAMLPDLVAQDRLGRVSGWAWGIGYAGGLVCLLLALLLFVWPDPSPFGLDRAAAEHVRIVAPFAALWFALFAWPVFAFLPDRPRRRRSLASAVRLGVADLGATLAAIRSHRNIARFLLAKMIYIDGLNTLFLFGGIYAAGVFHMTFEEVLLFGILLNVTAGLGAVGFAWVDDWLGAKTVIAVSLVALAVLAAAILFLEDKAWFYAVSLAIGIFLGPAQAASRSLMARLSPPDRRAEFFGLYSFAGKATAFFGPLLVAWATAAFASQRAGLAAILPFFVVGLLLLLTVREPQQDRSATETPEKVSNTAADEPR